MVDMEKGECVSQQKYKRLTNNITQDLPTPHSHPEEDLVLHDQNSDAKEDTDEADVTAPVIEVRLEKSDHGMNLL